MVRALCGVDVLVVEKFTLFPWGVVVLSKILAILLFDCFQIQRSVAHTDSLDQNKGFPIPSTQRQISEHCARSTRKQHFVFAVNVSLASCDLATSRFSFDCQIPELWSSMEIMVFHALVGTTQLLSTSGISSQVVSLAPC